MSLNHLKGKWEPGRSVTRDSNEFHLIAFDPGAAASGWAHFVLDIHAFSRPDNKVLANLKSWDCGQYTGSEYEQYTAAQMLVWRAKYGNPTPDGGTKFIRRGEVVSEDFQLVQTIGGRNLLAPVRFNAVLSWECGKLAAQFFLQNRSDRTGQTAERLTAMGFEGRWSTTAKSSKDEFSAMQHGVTWLKKLKRKADSFPWRLGDRHGSNLYWDCKCNRNPRHVHGATHRYGACCDLTHPN